ncbi:helix-turn-helix domain-containing protein [Escherichia coli]|uniref:helix-turn-helix domain-containing protein n=1 Tax=Escherichia coli TaxID=562 RepID=UPI0023EC707C|nr:helix-turn-helix domain-containing protein [Escherichia coli]MDF4164601.1 helix-turn-helix domain-containing protein [Escherichia coli]
MNKIEENILKHLKEGKSQSAIATLLGIPRSTVQRVSDTELGVDPTSLKSLTTDQIANIQRDSAAGNVSNAFLAKVYGVSAKTIARALLVRITEEKNKVTVISPIKPEEQEVFEVQPGGTAKDKDGTEWYVGAYLPNHNKYLCLTNDGNFKGAFFEKSELTPVEGDSRAFDVEAIGEMAEISVALSEGADKVPSNVEISVVVDGETYPIRGSLDARRRVGYFDGILGRTLRLALSSVEFTVAVKDVEEVADDKKTKQDFGAKDLDVFLNEHQILILPDSVVIAIDGKPETITTSHPAYDRIVQAIKDKDVKLAYSLMRPREAIAKYAAGLVDVSDNRVRWSGHDITGTSIAKRVLALMLKGDFHNLDRMAKFMDKMFQNPSASLVQSGRIYEFMAYSDIEIDDDGDIILYKSVRGNYMDKHSNTISNAPGTIVRMARSFVNDNNSELCSYGLHVCSLAYLKECFGSVGQRVVRCKLNPRDIVSVTDDFGSSKIRCCEYLVLDDYTAEYNRQHKSIDVTGLYK